MSDLGMGGGRPPDGDVDLAALVALFDGRKHSHGFLVFFALLDALEAREGDGPVFLPIDELVVRALAHAWVPRFTFRLSFGPGDRIGLVLDRLPPALRFGEPCPGSAELRQRLREALDEEDLFRLGRYMLRRLARPFFVAHLRAAPEAAERPLLLVARERLGAPRSGPGARGETAPFYRLDPSRRLLELEPAWRDYFRAHGTILRGWAAWRWVRHLEGRNPLALGLARKLFAPAPRAVPEAARRYWRAVAERVPLRCPYSGDLLDPDRATVEAFVPWTFLGDDPLWNLTPASPRAGAAKGERFPDLDAHLGALADLQAQGIVAARDLFERGELARLLEPFFADLQLLPDLVLGDAPKEWLARALKVAYGETLRPLEALARRQGFETGWRWSEVA
jgi:hypothetical protein